MTETTKPKKPKKNTWPEERVEILKKLWLDGLSASQIAAKLGDGITRNAVIGKVHRLGLSGRGSPNRVSKPKTRRPRQTTTARPARTIGNTAINAQTVVTPKPRLQPIAEPIKLADIPKGKRIGILGLTEKTCRWPLGDPGTDDFCFCGQHPRDDGPYCDYHAQIAYQPADRRRPARRVTS